MARIGPRGRRRQISISPIDPDDEDDQDLAGQIQTSIVDLTNQANVNQFDRTFTDAAANLAIEGAFDPVAGPKQVLPRIAYVLNFNLVWNEDRQRWEPKKNGDPRPDALDSGTLVAEDVDQFDFGTNLSVTETEGGDEATVDASGGGGGGAAVTRVGLSGTQTISASTRTRIAYDEFEENDVSGFDTSTSIFTVPSDGTYTFHVSTSWFDVPDDVLFRSRLETASIEAGHAQPGNSGADRLTFNTISTTLELTSGQELDVIAFHEAAGDEVIAAFNDETYWAIVQHP